MIGSRRGAKAGIHAAASVADYLWHSPKLRRAHLPKGSSPPSSTPNLSSPPHANILPSATTTPPSTHNACDRIFLQNRVTTSLPLSDSRFINHIILLEPAILAYLAVPSVFHILKPSTYAPP